MFPRHPVTTYFNRNSFVFLFATALFVVIGPGPGEITAQADNKPNVVFITIDDLRLLHHYDPMVRTQNMDRLAEWGMRFERAYVQATYCNPSRSSFLTGRRPGPLGITNNRRKLHEVRPDLTTLPERFNKAGYLTMSIGKIFHGAPPPGVFDRKDGFGPTKAGRSGEWHDLSDGRLGWCKWRAPDCDDLDLPDGRMARRAAAFVREDHDQPFFLALGFHKPHDPFVAPKKYFDLYPLEDLMLHERPANATEEPFKRGRLEKVFDSFSDRDRREFLRSYYAGATYMDAQLGRVLDALRDAERLDNTIVVLLSDHGYHLGERNWWNKTTLYEYTMRTPLIVYTPDGRATRHRTDAMVEFIDIYPTLVDLTNVDAPHALPGESFAPILHDADRDGKDVTFGVRHWGNRVGRTVRTERWRYIEYRHRKSGKVLSQQLFDHRSDSGEFHNLAKQDRHADVVDRMQSLLEPRWNEKPKKSGQ